MVSFLVHIVIYLAVVSGILFAVNEGLVYRRKLAHNDKHARLHRITQLERSTGVGIYWMRDRDELEPVYRRPNLPSYATLKSYGFVCYGCGRTAIYADYHGQIISDKTTRMDLEPTGLAGTRDKKRLLCNDCFDMPSLLG